MAKPKKPVPGGTDAWESGRLGASKEHAVARSRLQEQAVDDALDLQLISIRLPKAMIEDLKFLAAREGLGYQPLIRRVMKRYVQGEFKAIVRGQDLVAPRPPATRKRAAG